MTTLIACLLALIVLILLFGAGAMKNAILVTIGYIVGGILLIVVLAMTLTLLGDNGPYILIAVGAVIGLSAWYYQLENADEIEENKRIMAEYEALQKRQNRRDK